MLFRSFSVLVKVQLETAKILLDIDDTLNKGELVYSEKFKGIRDRLRYMKDHDDYSGFDEAAEEFKGFFDDFSKAADEDQRMVEKEDAKEKETQTENNKPTSDPSGYVYEAVPGNRLQGAEVSLYCEDDISQAPLLWDAVAYGQEEIGRAHV